MYSILIDGNQHKVGNKECTEGWCGSKGLPAKCSCGGLIHAEFGDEDADGDYWLMKMCDKCGSSFEYYEEV
jgi:hypothetical protein